MPGKDDPLARETERRPGQGRTLWLNRDNMERARDNYWRAYQEINPVTVRTLDDKHTWDIAWAVAIAAHAYIWEGRTEPR